MWGRAAINLKLGREEQAEKASPKGGVLGRAAITFYGRLTFPVPDVHFLLMAPRPHKLNYHLPRFQTGPSTLRRPRTKAQRLNWLSVRRPSQDFVLGLKGIKVSANLKG